MGAEVVAEAVRSIRAGLDALLSADLGALTSTELTGLLSCLEVEKRRGDAVDARLVAEIGERWIAGEYGRYSAADLVTTLLRVTPAEAKARVARAGDLGPRRTMTGERLEPILPVVAEAVHAGEISVGHVGVITKALDAIPGDISLEAAPVAERFLVEAARHEHPARLAKTAALLLARLDPDGAAPRDADIQRRRGFSLHKYADGTSVPSGLFTAELTALVETLFDSLAAPVPAVDGAPDERSPQQRRHDAIGDAIGRLLRSDTLPTAGGSPLTILATVTLNDLQRGTGVATTGHGDQISIPQLMAMAGDADLVPVILSDCGGILGYGRTRRLASRGQRLALAARDGGCCFPGCDRPASWTEVHHVKSWTDVGPTDLDNMCLLCRFHHREFEQRGWEVIMIDGAPHWIPPPWLDPDRRPIRNTSHHREIEWRDPGCATHAGAAQGAGYNAARRRLGTAGGDSQLSTQDTKCATNPGFADRRRRDVARALNRQASALDALQRPVRRRPDLI